MSINLSFIKLKGKVTDNYELTKTNWKNKTINWSDVHKVISNSNIQYSCYKWRNGYKTFNNFERDLQDCIVFDIDDGMSIAKFQKRFKRYKYILGTTKNSMKDKKGITCERFRVILPAINIASKNDVYFRSLKIFCPDNDEQTLTNTASFLGNSDAIVIRNEGRVLDMFHWNELAEAELKKEVVDKVVIDKDLLPNYGSMSIKTVKEQLTYEIVVEVLESCGYEMEGNAFRLRDSERTASARVKRKTLNITDYGDREAGGDIFSILVNHQGMTFKEAIRYVSNFI